MLTNQSNRLELDEEVFDAGQCFAVPEIEPFIHRNLKIPETVSGQARLKRKWVRGREDLHQQTFRAPDDIFREQLILIRTLVDFAYTHHPFYRDLYRQAGYRRGDIVSWEDYDCLPTISKADIVENFDKFCGFSSPSPEECYSSRTSGSSGQVLVAMFDQAMIDEDILRCLRFYDQMVGRRRDPEEWFYQIYVAAPPFTSLLGDWPIFTVSNECDPEVVLRHLRKMKPTILSGLPSYLRRLGALVNDPEAYGIQAINTNSESSTPQERHEIGKAFGAKVFDEYSSVELGLIATQCEHGNYHLVEDNCRIDAGKVNGETIATSLINFYMPFIRYRQGDQISISDPSFQCPCGSKFRVLSDFAGRADQFLQSSVNGAVPPDRVMSLYDRFLLVEEAGVGEFRIVQSDYNLIKIFIVPRSERCGVNQAMVDHFKNGLAEIMAVPDLTIEVDICNALPKSNSYKRRLIVSDIGREDA